MPLNEDQERALLTNLARDRAENLRNEIIRMMEEARSTPRPDLTEEQRQLGEAAMRKALESAQRMVDNLDHALGLAEKMADEARPPRDADEEE
jgi:molecular chaperone GrpE (heat shock protein)